jgi:hypothetical protein
MAPRCSPQVFLNGHEFRRKQLVKGQHERLNDPGHPAVAVSKRVDGSYVEVSHGCPHDYVAGGISIL